MSFDDRDIRRAMDVYTFDNVYLGTVLAVTPGPESDGAAPPAEEPPRSSLVSGELLGPAPTQAVGNRGPQVQSARAGYAVALADGLPLGRGAITVGRWWGLVGRRVIAIDDVQTVALERVVLRLRASDLGLGRAG